MSVFLIAEAGVNHNGDLGLAMRLIDAACEAGADAVKFQTFRSERLVCRHAGKAEYQKLTTGEAESQLTMLKRLELDEENHRKLLGHCRGKGIEFLSSPFDLESIDLLAGLGLATLKIPSGEITNIPYLRKIGALGKKLIVSTGMATLGEIEQALGVLTEAGTARDCITILHCTTEYPAPFEEVNLLAMETLREAFKVKVGYSDHTEGIEVALAAVALGAEVLEKHFTLDKTLEGPDHRASLEPGELALLVKSIRNVELAMGNGIKAPGKGELKNMESIRKSLVASEKIRKGDRFTATNLAVKRPGTGISPHFWDSVIGKYAKRDFDLDELIEL
ncbi:MAG: N-acetylneuraminate synthase [Candidatus Eremiobacteraeota bacterium]|nr:N-acetylneuraminate synthase [Candidatus Eremiobacteraeota bacterium]